MRMIMPTVPKRWMPSADGSSSDSSVCAHRRTRRSLLASASSTAATDISRDTISGTTMYGKTTRSRMGNSASVGGISSVCLMVPSGKNSISLPLRRAASSTLIGRARPRRSTMRGTRRQRRPPRSEAPVLRQVGRTRQIEDAAEGAEVALGALVGGARLGRELWTLLPFDDERVAERVDLHVFGVDAGQLDLEHVLVAVGAQIGNDAHRAGRRGGALGLKQLADDLLRLAA